ncbi:MAG: Do family serine endopeptidase [Thermoguttaceae bacterium]|nr:Do family serine endopeptidase [Thermoguttaceae bacterium]MDW8077951.1 Do family serine endopeptidase [Thermoguttaceae bacterium]
MNRRRRSRWPGWVLTGAVVGLLMALGTVSFLWQPLGWSTWVAAQDGSASWPKPDYFLNRPNTPAPESDVAAAVEHAKSLSRAFRYAAQQVLPTVVKIRTITRPERVGRDRTPSFPFGDILPNPEGPFSPRPQPQPGLGSGVIIHPEGIILTNRHVVEDSEEIVVQLYDGREYRAAEVRSDDQTDLAVIRVTPEAPLPAARLGDSDQLEIGDWVIAIGHPFELEQTVSAGIISAKGRTLSAVQRARFLQTDAAINPGNSGGPLVNLDGEVVGINTAIFSRTGGNQGIGFAIPINLAKWVVPQLIQFGRVPRSYLGIELLELPPAKARELGSEGGVLVGRVFPGSPAEKAGVRRQDVIVSYDGRPVRYPADLQELVERSPADTEHQLELFRDGKRIVLNVIVKPMPEDFGTRALADLYHDRNWGMLATDLTPEVAKRLGLKVEKGVLVVHVDPGRPAARAGLREGMIIVEVGGKAVGSVAEFQEAIRGLSLEQGIPIVAETRDGRRDFVVRQSQ